MHSVDKYISTELWHNPSLNSLRLELCKLLASRLSFSQTMISRLQQRDDMWVYCYMDEVKGFAICEYYEDIVYGQTVQVAYIVTSESNRGVGTLLLNAIKSDCLEAPAYRCETLLISTSIDQSVANDLYSGMGDHIENVYALRLE